MKVFFLTALFGGMGAAAGSVAGHSLGKPGLFAGALAGGIIAIAVAVNIALRRNWISRTNFVPTLLGGEIGFLVAAPVAVQMLSNPLGPILSTVLVGGGALIGSRRDTDKTRSRVGGLVLAAALAGVSNTAIAQSVNWRDFQSISFGRVRAVAQISSARTLRLITAIDNARIIGPEVSVDTVLQWKTGLWNDLDNPKLAQYVLANAFLVQPFAADSAHIGYLLTVADTSGESKQAILDKGAIEEFLDLLSNAAMAGRVLTDAELRKNSPIVATPVTLAKPYKAVYPRTAKLVGLSGKALVQFVVDTLGKAKPETITTVEATFKDFGDAAASYVTDMTFTPARIDGHAVERLVQYPFDFKLSTVMPITPFQVPTRRR